MRLHGGNMRVLLTNDDGVHSPGLEAVRGALQDRHDVWTIAPDSERSAMSHYITVKNPVSCMHVGERIFASSGSPADCVIIGMLGALPQPPELVISGINIGANLGSDIIYSGTCAAARQAAIMGIPGIALSLDAFKEPLHFDPLARFIRENLDELVGLWNGEHFINVNAPNSAELDKRIEITSPSIRIYHDKLARFHSPKGDVYFFMDGGLAETELEPGTDWYAVSHGAISVSPIYLNPVNHSDSAAYHDAGFVTSKA